MGIALNFAGWTGREDFAGEGLPQSERVKDVLDITAAKVLVSQSGAGSVAQQAMLRSTIVDVSQCVSRSTYNKSKGTVPCFTTSTELYSYGHDRVILPQEMLAMHGFMLSRLEIPREVLMRDLKKMAGGGLSCPCLASILWSWHIMRCRLFEEVPSAG